jgi:NitT/TauT family transport system permease protein
MNAVENAAPPPQLGQMSTNRVAYDANEWVKQPSFHQRHDAWLYPLLLLIVIVSVWQLYGLTGNINRLFFSYPSQIWSGFLTLARGPLLDDLAVSGKELLFGFALSLIGIPLGLVIGSNRTLRIIANPIIDAVYTTPMVALTPLFVVWFGLGITSKVAVVFLMAVTPLLIDTIVGVSTVDPSLIRAARSFGAGRLALYRDVILPASTPFVVAGVRLAIGRAIVGVVLGEFIASVAGIGFRIEAAASVFRTGEYLAGVVVLMVVSIVLNSLIGALERYLAPWRTESGQPRG